MTEVVSSSLGSALCVVPVRGGITPVFAGRVEVALLWPVEPPDEDTAGPHAQIARSPGSPYVTTQPCTTRIIMAERIARYGELRKASPRNVALADPLTGGSRNSPRPPTRMGLRQHRTRAPRRGRIPRSSRQDARTSTPQHNPPPPPRRGPHHAARGRFPHESVSCAPLPHVQPRPTPHLTP